MTTAATTLLGLALPVTGELSGTWGDTVNNSITNLLDSAVAGTTTLSTDADTILTTTDLAANQARQAILLWTATGSVTRNITAPAHSKSYIVINKTGGTQSIVIRGSGPTTGVTIPAGASATVAWNGTDFVDVSAARAGMTLTGNLLFSPDNTYDIGASSTTYRPKNVYAAAGLYGANAFLGASTSNGSELRLSSAAGSGQGGAMTIYSVSSIKSGIGAKAAISGTGTDQSLMVQSYYDDIYLNTADPTKSIYLNFGGSSQAIFSSGGVGFANGLGMGGASSTAALLLNGSLSANTQNGYKFTNSNGGTGSTATLFLNSSASDAQLGVTSAGWTLDPLSAANQTYLYANGAGGLNLYTSTASASPVIVTTNGYQRIYVSGATGTLAGTKVGIGNSSPLATLDLGIAAGVKFLWYGSSSANQGYVAGLGVNVGAASNSSSFFLGQGAGSTTVNFEWLRGTSVSGNYPWTTYTSLMTLRGDGQLTVSNDIVGSAYIRTTTGFALANVGGDISGSGGSTNYIGIRDNSSAFKFATHTSGTYSGRTGLGTAVAQPNAILDMGSGYGSDGAKCLFYNDNQSGELYGTKVGIYMDRFSETNSVAMVFPQASGTSSRFHVAYKNTSGSQAINDVCYVTNGSTSWSFPSDERLKDVIAPITGALDILDGVRTVFFSWKNDPLKKRKVGTLAQDWLARVPEVIDVPEVEFDAEKAQGHLALSNADTIPILIAAINELKAEFRAYKASHP